MFDTYLLLFFLSMDIIFTKTHNDYDEFCIWDFIHQLSFLIVIFESFYIFLLIRIKLNENSQ